MKHGTNHYNAIVVGAGPAGCSAAYYLKESGKSVLMLDKMDFPRHKPCAGGITKKTLKHLPIDITHLVKHTAKKMKFSFDDKKSVKLNHNLGSCVMVIRDDFDNYYFKETVKIGVNFQKINKINKIICHDDNVFLTVDDKNISCKYLIGADGANSLVRKLATEFKYKNPVYAYEGKVKKNITKEDITEFIFNKSGYEWIFPKDDHLNIGIGNLIDNLKTKSDTKTELYKFAEERFGKNELQDVTAYPIGTEGFDYTMNDRIMLVGDAAGLAEKLLGEGIYNAVVSGKFAAKAIIEGGESLGDTIKSYNTFLSKLTSELNLYNKGSAILYNYPTLSYIAMKLWLGKKFMNGYSEGKTLSEIFKRKQNYIS
jgi:geranylgeranyl reductase family protein